MVERSKTAPPADNLRNDTDPSAFDAGNALFAEFWPPSGWPMFACVTRPSGTVMAGKYGVRGDQDLLKYEVRIEPEGIYTIEILKGTLGANGEISLQPALGMRFSGKEDWAEINAGKRPDDTVLELYVDGKQHAPERGLILRVILALTFMISRIDRGLMPNLKKTLRLYRLD